MIIFGPATTTKTALFANIPPSGDLWSTTGL